MSETPDVEARPTATKVVEIDSHAINFGPQHPAAHGVLRLILEMDGEVVERADPHIGLLHRGTEKLIEYKTYMQAVPYFDRLDYVSPMCEEHAFALAVEKLLGIEVPERGQWIRVLFAEITRVLNHLLNVTTYALDVGAITPRLWGFEEREKLMEFHEAASGARLHANYFRPGGVAKDLPAGLEATDRRLGRDVSEVHRRPGRAADRQPHLEAAHRRYRRDDAPSRRWPGVSPGRCLRASGVPWDLRRSQPYDKYAEVEFEVPVGRNGDCYDRYLVRLAEMRESVKIIKQCLAKMQPGPVKVQDHKFTPPHARRDEALDGGADPSLQAVYRGLSRAGRAPPTPRWKARRASSASIWSPTAPTGPIAARSARPGFAFLQAIDVMAKRHMLADAVAIIGSLDIVFGEIDR